MTLDSPLVDALTDGAPLVGGTLTTALDPAAWLRVCRLDDLVPERGAAALVDGVQVAVFRLADDSVRAVQQRDPFSGAYIMARGLVGTRGDVPTVASPMYKQVFDLTMGTCLEAMGADPQHLRTWPARVEEGTVYIGRTL